MAADNEIIYKHINNNINIDDDKKDFKQFINYNLNDSSTKIVISKLIPPKKIVLYQEIILYICNSKLIKKPANPLTKNSIITMALYSELQVFKASYDLLLLIFRTTPNVKREYRYCLLESIKKNTTNLCIEIYRANQSSTKEDHIIHALELVMELRLQLRIMRDLEQISVKLFSQLFSSLDTIGKQLSLWRRYSKKQHDALSVN